MMVAGQGIQGDPLPSLFPHLASQPGHKKGSGTGCLCMCKVFLVWGIICEAPGTCSIYSLSTWQQYGHKKCGSSSIPLSITDGRPSYQPEIVWH